MSNDPTMTQAHDISTEFPATGLTPLTSMSSSAPISPPSSQFDINHFWDDGDVSSISVDEFSMFDLMDEPTDALASSRPMVQLDSAGHTTEAGSAAALNELVKSAGAHLPSSEGMHLDSEHMTQSLYNRLTPSQLRPELCSINHNMLLNPNLIAGLATIPKALWLFCSSTKHSPPNILPSKKQPINRRAQAVRSRRWPRRKSPRGAIRTRLI